MISRCFLLCALAINMVCPSVGQEWCRFRGSNGTGESDTATIPITWTAKDYNWRVDLPGIGHSSPVVWGDRVFVTSAHEEDGTWIILCLRTSDGSIVWRKSFPSTTYQKNSLASYATSTPTVDENCLYTTWSTPAAYIVLALDQQSGREVWRRDLGPFVAQHGFGASPILFDNTLIVPNDQDGPSFVIALDRATGKTRWSVKRRVTKAAYSTPIVIQPAGEPPQLILTGGTQGISSYDPQTGNTNWELDVLKDRVVGSPTLAAGMIIAGYGEGGAGKQLFAIRPGETAKNIQPKVAYEFHGSLPYVPVPVAHGQLLFLWSDSGVVTCADVPTGKIHWRERVGGKFFGSPIRVQDRLYCMSCAGKMVVLAAADQYKLFGQIDLEEPSHSTPAVADGVLYLRTFSHLMSLGGKRADVKDNGRRAHSSVVPGWVAAKDASGRFVHEDVWRYLFTHPVEEVGLPVLHDPVYPVVQTADIRRISLEGKDGVPAPVTKPGKDGISRIAKVEMPSLELFPTPLKPARGTIMVCPGGGYGILAIEHEGHLVAKKLNEFGYDVAILLYHVSAGKETRELAIADAQAALALLQKRGDEFGLSMKKIGVMGFSAGGHLAARLTHVTAADTPPDFVVLMYPAYLEQGGKVLDEVAPVKTSTFVYVAGDDKYAPSAVAYAKACKERKVLCDFTKTEHGGHGFGLKPVLPPDVKDWPDKLHAFLDGLK